MLLLLLLVLLVLLLLTLCVFVNASRMCWNDKTTKRHACPI